MHIELGQAEPSLNWVHVTQLNRGTPIPVNYAGGVELGFNFVVLFLERNVNELNQLRKKALGIDKMHFALCQPPSRQDSAGDEKWIRNP